MEAGQWGREGMAREGQRCLHLIVTIAPPTPHTSRQGFFLGDVGVSGSLGLPGGPYHA